MTYLESFIDAPNQDIIVKISNINPSASLIVSFPGLEVDPVIKDANTISILATDVNRIVGNYLMQVDLKSPSDVPISFDFLISLVNPDWTEQNSGSRWGQIDISSFAIIFAISILISFLMTLIIHRARQRLARMQNRMLYQASESMSAFDIPKLYQVLLSVPSIDSGSLKFGLFKRHASSHKDMLDVIPNNTSTDAESAVLPKQKSMSNWTLSIPNFLRGFTSSLSTLDIFYHRDQWVHFFIA